ncbi:MAG: acetyl-CoA C-acetyltransferase [Dehalococcoidia bacterium]|nr:acetyl-CoA C-acetyltransferase [Dehalococcoidia bacterium]
MHDVIIASGVRTAIGDFGGALKDVSALELGKIVILEALKRAGIDKEEVNEVIMGNVLPFGLGQNPGRQAMLMAGLPVDVGAITVNKVCGSGLKAVMLASQAIALGDADIVVAGGMENMYQVPYYLPQARGGYRLWDGKLVDGMVHDGLWDIIADCHMGVTAENVAVEFNVTRVDQDNFTLNSYTKAQKAMEAGEFKDEIVPVEIPQRKGPPVVFDSDEVPRRKTSLEALSLLSPAFKKDGTVTAGNSSKISDGAAALVLMSGDRASKLGIKPLGRVVAHGSAGIDTNLVVAAPINSIPKILKKAGLNINDIDVHEINEAFASSTVAVIKKLGIDEKMVNIRGGAISLGHPIGCSGARVLVTLLNIMKDKKKKKGMASLCLGGGEAVSMIVERL